MGGAFGHLGGLAEGAAALAPTAGKVAGTLAGAAGVGETAGLAVGIAGGAAYGLARGTGWVLENTLFRPQQGSEDAAAQDVRSANGMNTGSSTSGSPASSRASSRRSLPPPNTSYVTARHDAQYFPSLLSSFSPTTSRVCRVSTK